MPIDPAHYARRWKTLAVLSLALLVIGLDNTILNVALPSLQEHFQASSSTLPRSRGPAPLVDAPVDRRPLPARVRRPPPHDGHARRPLRTQARASSGPRAVRRGEP